MSILTNATDIHLSFTSGSVLVQRSAAMSMGCWVQSSTWNGGSAVSMLSLVLSGTTGVQKGTRGGNAIDVWSWGGALAVSTYGLVYTPTANTWMHVMYTYDGTTHSLYSNGTLLATSTAAVTPGGLNQLYVNGYPTGVTNETSATSIDDVVLFNRCLSYAEVQILSEQTLLSSGIFNGLLANYDFCGPSGSVVSGSVPDLSSNHSDLTVVNGGAGTSLFYAPCASSLHAICLPLT